MVRLKGFDDLKNVIASTFQFHNGTIKSNEKKNLLIKDLEFQFHNGTIKRNAL